MQFLIKVQLSSVFAFVSHIVSISYPIYLHFTWEMLFANTFEIKKVQTENIQCYKNQKYPYTYFHQNLSRTFCSWHAFLLDVKPKFEIICLLFFGKKYSVFSFNTICKQKRKKDLQRSLQLLYHVGASSISQTIGCPVFYDTFDTFDTDKYWKWVFAQHNAPSVMNTLMLMLVSLSNWKSRTSPQINVGTPWLYKYSLDTKVLFLVCK